MTDVLPVAPLAARVRMSDPDYPGVLIQVSPDWRLAVSASSSAYCFQRRVDTPEGEAWIPAGGRSPKSLSGILSKFSELVPDLVAAFQCLPELPDGLLAGFRQSADARRAAFAARDVRGQHYARVAVRDGQLRIAVSPDEPLYLLQWVPVADLEFRVGQLWQTLVRSPDLAGLCDYVACNIVSYEAAGAHGPDDLSARFHRLVAGFPEHACDGSWPYVPPFPM